MSKLEQNPTKQDGNLCNVFNEALVDEVEIRTSLQRLYKHISSLNCIEYESMLEEVETAINSFLDAEIAIGNAYRHCVVAMASEMASI